MRLEYFVNECPELEELLERHFEHLRALLRQRPRALEKVDALVLGGGYGRGEGGVLAGPAPDAPPELFNDLDYFLFTSHAGHPEVAQAVHAMEAAGKDTLGIDVDIKCLAPADMGDPSASMMFSDLVAGHRVIHGPADYLRARFPEVDPSRLPALEASRLLWNRGTGLYFAACHIERREDPAFVARNHAKFKLAAGDALLALAGRYHGSCRERFHRFRECRPDRALGLDLADLHAEGVAFKLAPRRGHDDWDLLSRENRALAGLWSRLFLHAESLRLGVRFESASAYVQGREPRSPELPRWKPPLFALRDFFHYRRWLSPIRDYPRAALFRSLFCLLSHDDPPAALPSPNRFLNPSSPPNASRSTPVPLSSWESAYAFWWQRYG